MINLSQKNVVKMAKETNFIKDNVEKVMRLADILESVSYTHLRAHET